MCFVPNTIGSSPFEMARQSYAKCVAMVVRNAMDDFHSKYLTDEQMIDLVDLVIKNRS